MVKRAICLLPIFVPVALFSCAGSTGFGSIKHQKETHTFKVVTPRVKDVLTQEDVVPFLQEGLGPKIPLPLDLPLYLKNGERVEPTYLGLKGYTIDIVCESVNQEEIFGATKATVNQTHEEMAPMVYYLGIVHQFGNDRYFSVEIDFGRGPRIENYIVPWELNCPEGRLLAGMPSNGAAEHVAKLEVLKSGDEIKEVGIWDYGDLLVE